jgi:CheY-like chemotaxis protein
MPPKKILLVDDSTTALMMAKMILKSTRYQLTVAHDGQEAVEVALREHPDLILMDVVMPRMTGLEACQKLRQHPSTSAIPIILVTTRGEEGSVKEGFRSGCNEYITKPISGIELLSKLRTHLGE